MRHLPGTPLHITLGAQCDRDVSRDFRGSYIKSKIRFDDDSKKIKEEESSPVEKKSATLFYTEPKKEKSKRYTIKQSPDSIEMNGFDYENLCKHREMQRGVLKSYSKSFVKATFFILLIDSEDIKGFFYEHLNTLHHSPLKDFTLNVGLRPPTRKEIKRLVNLFRHTRITNLTFETSFLFYNAYNKWILANCLKHTKRLTHLDMSKVAMKDAFAADIVKNIQKFRLEELNLSNNQLGNTHLSFLTHSHFRWLTKLDLSHNPQKKIDLAPLTQFLLRQRKLKQLFLNFNQYSDLNLKHLSTAIHNSQLEELSLAGNKFSVDAVNILIDDLPSTLKKLNLNHVFCPAGCTHSSSKYNDVVNPAHIFWDSDKCANFHFEALNNIEVLSMKFSPFTNQDASRFVSLIINANLKKLYISPQAKISRVQKSELYIALFHKNVDQLFKNKTAVNEITLQVLSDIYEEIIPDEYKFALKWKREQAVNERNKIDILAACLKSFDQLKSINLSRPDKDDYLPMNILNSTGPSIEEDVKVCVFKHLEQFVFTQNRLAQHMYAELREILKVHSKTIKKLSLGHHTYLRNKPKSFDLQSDEKTKTLGDQEMEMLAPAFQYCNQLEQLKLYCRDLGKNGFEILVKYLPPTMTHFYFENVLVNPDNLCQDYCYSKLDTIKHLYLPGRQITAKDAQELCLLIRKGRLETLDLSGIPIRDENIKKMLIDSATSQEAHSELTIFEGTIFNGAKPLFPPKKMMSERVIPNRMSYKLSTGPHFYSRKPIQTTQLFAEPRKQSKAVPSEGDHKVSNGLCRKIN